MQLLTTGIIFSTVLVADIILAELSPDGENVCLQTETYEAVIEVEVLKPVTEIQRKRCWRITKFFRCEKEVTKLKLVKEPQVVKRTRIVPKCCDGYAEEKGQVNKCSPVCLNGCKNGKCAAPSVCACSTGFYGSMCEKACPKNFWGNNCANKCNCFNSRNCDNISGRCHCDSGWTGRSCELPCQEGYYGYSCKKKCDCYSHLCNHKTGECLTTTTETPATTAPSSTTEKSTTEASFETYKPTESSTTTTILDEKTSILTDEILSGGTRRTVEETASSEISSESSNVTATLGGEDATMKKTEESNENEEETKTINLEQLTIISGRKKSSSSQTTLKIFHFIPSLSVISSVSFLIFIIATKWIISKHRKNSGKRAAITGKEEKLFQSEEQIKFQSENFFWVNSCTKNPLPDVELYTTPILETFKPGTSSKGLISKEKELNNN